MRQLSGPPPEPVPAADGVERCASCGAPLEAPGLRERIAAKLTQLRRFGLTAGARPLLEFSRRGT